MEIVTKSAKETRELGKKIAANIANRTKNIERRVERAIFALTGELGSGKTTFVQGMAEGLGVKQRVISPTFILMRKYKISPSTIHHPLFTSFYHVDLYRLEADIEKEMKNLGLDDILLNPENIVAIEWAEKIENIIPKKAIWIKLENVGEGRRKIVINYP